MSSRRYDPRSYYTPLFRPGRYFRRGGRPSLALGVAFVLVGAILSWIGTNWYVITTVNDLDLPGFQKEELLGELSSSPLSAVGFLLGWVLLAAFYHAVVRAANGDGTFGDTLAVVGEANLVGIVVFPLTMYAALAFAGDIPSDPRAAVAFLEQAPPWKSPLILATAVLNTGWQAAISGYGLSRTHDIDAARTLVLTVFGGFAAMALALFVL